MPGARVRHYYREDDRRSATVLAKVAVESERAVSVAAVGSLGLLIMAVAAAVIFIGSGACGRRPLVFLVL